MPKPIRGAENAEIRCRIGAKSGAAFRRNHLPLSTEIRCRFAPIFAASVSGCGTIGSAALSGEGPSFVGQPAQNLFAAKGAPLRQITSPSGATIYVYEAHNLMGATFCEASFYVRDQIVVGFSAHGPAPTCGGSAGRID
jgi:hypothetical protein